MPDHLKVTSWLGIARCVAGLTLGSFLLLKVLVAGLPLGYSSDARILLWLAGACFTLATLRLVLAFGAFRCWSWTRKVGLALAVFDCVNLVFFPVSTALGLQGLVAYRHSETLHYFRRLPRPEPVV